MMFLRVIAAFSHLICLTSTFHEVGIEFNSAMPPRHKRSLATDCAREFNPQKHICCGHRLHRRGEGPVDCCNGKFFNPTTHICNGRSALPKHARECGPGLQWIPSSKDSKGECQLCPKGSFKSNKSERQCRRCHKCEKYGEVLVYSPCKPTQNALCDYPWIWKKLHLCSRKKMCHSHYKDYRGITRKKMEDKLKKWENNCGSLQMKRELSPEHMVTSKVCDEWMRMEYRRPNLTMAPNMSIALSSSPPVSQPETLPSSSTDTASAATTVTRLPDVLTTLGFILKSDIRYPKLSSSKAAATPCCVTGATNNSEVVAMEDPRTHLDGNNTVAPSVPFSSEVILTSVFGIFAIVSSVTIVVAVVVCRRKMIRREKSHKGGQGSSLSTLLSNRSSVSSSKAYEVAPSLVIAPGQTLLHPVEDFSGFSLLPRQTGFLAIACSTASPESGYNSYASKSATLTKDHGSNETTCLHGQNSLPCKEIQAGPLHIRVEEERPRRREASMKTRYGIYPSVGPSERLESSSGSNEGKIAQDIKIRSTDSLESSTEFLVHTDPAAPSSRASSSASRAPAEADASCETSSMCPAKTISRQSLAFTKGFQDPANEILGRGMQGMNETGIDELETKTNVHAAVSGTHGSSSGDVREHHPQALFEDQQKVDDSTPAPIMPSRPRLLEQQSLRGEMNLGSVKRRPLSDPLPKGERQSAAEIGRRHTYPTGSSTKLHLRVPPSPDGTPDFHESDDDEDADYDEVATISSTEGEDDGNVPDEQYDDTTSWLRHLQPFNDSTGGACDGTVGSKPSDIGLNCVRNPLCQPPGHFDPSQSRSLISSMSVDVNAVSGEEGLHAARTSRSSPPLQPRKQGVRGLLHRANDSNRSHCIDAADEFHPTGRNPSETLRSTKVKNTNLTSMNREGNVLSSTQSMGGGPRKSGGPLVRSPRPELLHLTKDSEVHKDNLLSSYSAEMATQTEDSQGKRDLLGGHWQFSAVFSPEGGVLEREHSDVRVLIPKDSVPLATKISGSIHTNVSRLQRKLFRKHSDCVLLSPVAEFHASVAAFHKRVLIEIPFVEPGGFKKTCFKVMGFTCENNRDVTISEVPLLRGSDEEESATESTAEDPDCYYTFSGPGLVTVHTSHFSGYYCVHCKQNITTGLYAVVFGSRSTTQLPTVRVRLYVMDDKIMLKDYKEQFNEDELKAGRSYLDKKEIRLHENIHSRSFLIFELTPEGRSADQWKFRIRRNGELRTERRQTERLEHMVQCCQKREPAFVEWLLEGTGGETGGQAVTVMDFECVVDIWNHKTNADLLDSDPDGFRPESSARAHTVLNVCTQRPDHLDEYLKAFPTPGDLISVLSHLSTLNVEQLTQVGMKEGFPDTPRSVPQPFHLVQPHHIQAASRGESPRCPQAMAELPRDLGHMASNQFPAMPVQRQTTGQPPQDASVNTHAVQETAALEEERKEETEVLKVV